jgi:hypothetical protein
LCRALLFFRRSAVATRLAGAVSSFWHRVPILLLSISMLYFMGAGVHGLCSPKNASVVISRNGYGGLGRRIALVNDFIFAG